MRTGVGVRELSDSGGGASLYRQDGDGQETVETRATVFGVSVAVSKRVAGAMD